MALGWPWGGLAVALGGLRALPPLFLLFTFCFYFVPRPPPAYGLGDGAKPPENRQNLPVAALHQLWQDGAAMNESEKQFSFTRAGSSTSGRAKHQIPISPLEPHVARQCS